MIEYNNTVRSMIYVKWFLCKHQNMAMLNMSTLNILLDLKPLASHHEYCKSYEAIKIELPEEGSEMSFQNHYSSMPVRLIEYALTPQLSTRPPNPENCFTKQYQKHIDSEFFYHIKCFDDTLYSQRPVSFVKEFNDDDAAQIFKYTFEKNSKEIYTKFKL